MPALVLPIPPSVNGYWVRNRHGGMMIGAPGREYRDSVRLAAIEAGIAAPMASRVRVVIDVYFGDRRKRDIDNVLKATLDAATKAGLWVDDEQIDDLRITRGAIDREYPRLVLWWEEIAR